MPTDNVTNRTFADLFEARVRYVIPFFQRGYAWEKRQWDDLFNDLQEQILADLDADTPMGDVEHFFGPIVVQARQPDIDGIPEFLIIDGQQRITTIYLLLGLIMEQLMAKSSFSNQASDYALSLRSLLTNGDISPGDDYRRMKVFSSKGDRLPTYKVIFGADQKPKSEYYETDIRLYSPGHNKVDEFQAYATKKLKNQFNDVTNLWRLAQVLLTCLKVVWIPLKEGRDDAQAIFESLNDKGMPLSASELLCSYLFRPLMASEDFESLHNEEWLDAMQISRGREKFEEFLRHFFSIGEKKMIGKGRKVYVHFKTKNRSLNSPTARHHLMEIHESAPIYQKIVDPSYSRHPHPKVRELLEAIAPTRMDSCSPFLLATLRAHGNGRLSDDEVIALFRETLVLLVRRKMTEQSTTIYDQLFPNLFGRIADEPDKVRAIHEQFKQKFNVWVSNQEFEDAFVRKTLYRGRDLPFTRMVLIELDKRLERHGQLPDYSTLPTIEHVIPQELDQAWKDYLEQDAKDDQLSTIIHSAGNLCLLSQPANSFVGRDPFEAKKSAYPYVTALTRQLKDHPGPWNIAAVRERSRLLGNLATEVWAWGQP